LLALRILTIRNQECGFQAVSTATLIRPLCGCTMTFQTQTTGQLWQILILVLSTMQEKCIQGQ
ncbi:MAG: hypothetical protein WBP54_12585, partial [Pelodictyon phaeoclathratiforme]